jgi:hypothetical protein
LVGDQNQAIFLEQHGYQYFCFHVGHVPPEALHGAGVEGYIWEE